MHSDPAIARSRAAKQMVADLVFPGNRVGMRHLPRGRERARRQRWWDRDCRDKTSPPCRSPGCGRSTAGPRLPAQTRSTPGTYLAADRVEDGMSRSSRPRDTIANETIGRMGAGARDMGETETAVRRERSLFWLGQTRRGLNTRERLRGQSPSFLDVVSCPDLAQNSPLPE
jgi:hypothetical protein